MPDRENIIRLIEEMFLDAIHGFKKLLMVTGLFLLACAVLWGVISGLMTIFGAIEFRWWNIPCWALAVFSLAACFGQDK